MKRPTVAIVGRPNVGKSTLFNRIVGGREAIVHDRAGITRDRHFATGDWSGRYFWLVDTGGWIATASDPLSSGIRHQIELAIADSDAILLVVDTSEGTHPADLQIAELLRAVTDRVLVVANKADDLSDEISYHEFHELGLGVPYPVSAITGKGSGDLLDQLVSLLPDETEEAQEEATQVAVVGRPNVGKSSLMNRLLGEERSIVAPEPGTTRDAVDSFLRYQGTALNFIDTAGLRKRPKIKDDIEFYSTLRTARAIERADVCVLVVDAAEGVRAQDLKIAHSAWESGSGLIIAVNKWDLIEEKESNTASQGQAEVLEKAPFLSAVSFVYMSALTGFRARKILDLILAVAGAREQRVKTAEVNRVLQELVNRAQPPQRAGQGVKLMYASQVAVRPPTFAVFSNRPEAVPESYRRYLLKGFRKAWGFSGTPVRLRLRRKRDRR